MGTHAERGMSAPPEVVFSTATDPDRVSAWLPNSLRRNGDGPAETDGEQLRARWEGDAGAAELRVEPADAGGSRVRLELPEGDPGLADETLTNLAREVAENLTAG
ncbi:hypothetical protein V6U81_10815 [Micromonospora sp. CPCC 205711]|uniref:hypothetical protein n=1 Tax=Micromonospora sp. CPCC 205547 TaxID=3122400 RepID=UPI002FF1D270